MIYRTRGEQATHYTTDAITYYIMNIYDCEM